MRATGLLRMSDYSRDRTPVDVETARIICEFHQESHFLPKVQADVVDLKLPQLCVDFVDEFRYIALDNSFRHGSSLK